MEPSIIHIDSHARFIGDPNDIFVLAYTVKITNDDQSEIIELAKYREKPLDLLMLSACQTAMGDERTALGLAGI